MKKYKRILAVMLVEVTVLASLLAVGCSGKHSENESTESEESRFLRTDPCPAA